MKADMILTFGVTRDDVLHQASSRLTLELPDGVPDAEAARELSQRLVTTVLHEIRSHQSGPIGVVPPI